MENMCGVYKYVVRDTGKPFYIGESSDLLARIQSHNVAEEFEKYKDNYRLYVAFCKNEAEALIVESGLIAFHRPEYNKKGTTRDDISNRICAPDQPWIEVSDAFPKRVAYPNIDLQWRWPRNKEYLPLGSGDYYLSNKNVAFDGHFYFDSIDKGIFYLRTVLLACNLESNDYSCSQYSVPMDYEPLFFHYDSAPTLCIIRDHRLIEELKIGGIKNRTGEEGQQIKEIVFEADVIARLRRIIEPIDRDLSEFITLARILDKHYLR